MNTATLEQLDIEIAFYRLQAESKETFFKKVSDEYTAAVASANVAMSEDDFNLDKILSLPEIKSSPRALELLSKIERSQLVVRGKNTTLFVAKGKSIDALLNALQTSIVLALEIDNNIAQIEVLGDGSELLNSGLTEWQLENVGVSKTTLKIANQSKVMDAEVLKWHLRDRFVAIRKSKYCNITTLMNHIHCHCGRFVDMTDGVILVDRPKDTMLSPVKGWKIKQAGIQLF
jgi:hypothetical protein